MNSAVIEQRASLKDWMAVAGTSLGAFMAVLDITMNNSSIREIQGTLGAGIEEGSWIMTSYLMAEIIAIPISGWFSFIFSDRKYLLLNIFLFTFFSIVCGMARSLPMMIFARFFQGLSGGALIPLAASAVMTKLPLSQRSLGLAIFSITVAMGPAIGPTLGGWITSKYGWPYSFYLNFFPSLVVIGLIYFSYEKIAMKLNLLKDGDWSGLIAMIVGLSSLTYILEEGNRKDWLGDKIILRCLFVCIVSLSLFVCIELNTKTPLVNLRLFLNRNFSLATLAVTLIGGFLLGNIFILPNYLLQIQDYSALEIGKVALWNGPIQIPFTLAVPILSKYFESRWIITLGCIILFISCFLNSNLTGLTSGDQFILPQILRAIGSSFVLGSLTGLALSDVELSSMRSAVALFSLMRTLGGSLAIAGFGTFLSHRYFFHFNRITEKVIESNYTLVQLLEKRADVYLSRLTDGNTQALLALGQTIKRQAYIMAYADAYLILSLLVIFVIGLVLLIKVKKNQTNTLTMDH